MPDAGLDPLLHQPTRLDIMAYLYRNRQASFTQIRKDLGLTKGNLLSHGEKLAGAGYVEIGKVLVGVFEVRWRITLTGEEALESYLEQMLERLKRIAPADHAGREG